MKLFLFAFGLILPFQYGDNAWELFAKVRFEPRYFPEYKEKFLVPTFSKSILIRVGAEVTVQGHYLPVDADGKSIIISKYPYAACFFCGGAGPESVAEIFFEGKLPKLKPDQVITVRGKLRLNNTDVNHLNFILDDAVLL
jgi:hypothetical protein